MVTFLSTLAVEPDLSWGIIKALDLWEADDPDDGYVLVKQEEVVDGITSFMFAYLLPLKKTKDPSPDQLQKALRKTFLAEKKKVESGRPGMELKSFIMLLHGSLQLLAFLLYARMLEN